MGTPHHGVSVFVPAWCVGVGPVSPAGPAGQLLQYPHTLPACPLGSCLDPTRPWMYIQPGPGEDGGLNGL